MGFFEAIALAFIRTFGITEPTEQQRKQATWFILGLSVVMVLLLLVADIVFCKVVL